MYYLANEGDAVNRAINQFMCDSIEALEQIPKKDIQLGATAIVVTADSIRFFMANADKNWVEG